MADTTWLESLKEGDEVVVTGWPRERAEIHASSACAYDGRGGTRYLYPKDGSAYRIALSIAGRGGRASYRQCGIGDNNGRGHG